MILTVRNNSSVVIKVTVMEIYREQITVVVIENAWCCFVNKIQYPLYKPFTKIFFHMIKLRTHWHCQNKAFLASYEFAAKKYLRPNGKYKHPFLFKISVECMLRLDNTLHTQ